MQPFINKRGRFLQACHCQPVDRPPIWLMRQAGRALPEYRELKRQHSFLTLVRTPELAMEVTLQPVRRFGFDAAILFSDILVIPEAAGQGYQFRDAGGVEMTVPLRNTADLSRLRWDGICERLGYVDQALRLLRRELGQSTALLGFGGSPWTLANFMLEGGSSHHFQNALAWWKNEPKGLTLLLDKLTEALIQYFRLQIDAGVDAIQIFDSLAGLLDSNQYSALSGQYIGRIIQALGRQVPIIVFAKGYQGPWENLLATRPQVLSFDSTTPLASLRQSIPANIAMQGNLAPEIMTGPSAMVRSEALRILGEMNGRPGYIFNLGHGLPATTPVENIALLVETITQFAWEN